MIVNVKEKLYCIKYYYLKNITHHMSNTNVIT